MAKTTLKISTPHGEFTRTTGTAYTHAVVRTSPRAMKEGFERAQRGEHVSGVDQRWAKDRGFAVTWHGSESAAHAAAAKPYLWDHSAAVIGIYSVEA